MLGFEGPFYFTTGCCCHKKKFLGTTLGLNSVDKSSDSEETDLDDNACLEYFEAVRLPSSPKVAYTAEMTDIFVGEISRFFI